MFGVKGGDRDENGAGFTVKDRDGVRDWFRARSNLGFICFSSIVHESKI